ncbi:receptor kinase-like protein Xa21 [Pistacia vera]|uniref:receptor kinase-like protein Xa21 n=1 Tax=Pistacia vera TaxID=55513 RepID=UPI0012636264|nr:receptor kinase-like protein Xa21 [Pistacia vera]
MLPQETWRRISQHELVRATDGFSKNNLLGRGNYGSIYKGRLDDGMELAVKVFHLHLEGAFTSFEAECEVMSHICHRNLVKIISSCSNDDFKSLILEYMPNGSLEKCLYSDNYILDISHRLTIMIDVASALEYLHFGYSNHIIHCDLKPNNVLLDENMVAYLSVFGITKLLGEENSMTQTRTLATIGYMAPERNG